MTLRMLCAGCVVGMHGFESCRRSGCTTPTPLMQAAIASVCAMQSCYLDTVGTATSYDVNGRSYYAQVSTPGCSAGLFPASTRTVSVC